MTHITSNITPYKNTLCEHNISQKQNSRKILILFQNIKHK